MAAKSEVSIFVQTTGCFKDEEFLLAAKQVQNPRLEGWELFIEAMGLKIYRRYRQESGLYEYKTHGIMSDIDPEICSMVYLDWEYRMKWDTYASDIQLIESEETDIKGIYWILNFPWPMSKRDYTAVREGRMLEVDGQRTQVGLTRYQSFNSCPEKDGIIRVDQYWHSYALQSDGKSGMQIFMHQYDNPKGIIPTWLINWAAKIGVPQFIDTFRKAVFGYKDYLKEEGKEYYIEEAQKFWTRCN